MPPLAPSVSEMLSTVTWLAVTTSLVLKLPIALTTTVSPPTSPLVTVSTGAAPVVPSYARSGAVTLAVMSQA
jgi:hypothetical protein